MQSGTGSDKLRPYWEMGPTTKVSSIMKNIIAIRGEKSTEVLGM